MDYEPENDLFEVPGLGGLGRASKGRATCGLCGTVMNPEAESPEDPDDEGEQWYREIQIGDLTILDCCFPKIERLMLYLALETQLLPWLVYQLGERKEELQEQMASEEALRELAESAKAILSP